MRRDGGIRGKKVRVIKFGLIRGRMGDCVDEAFRENPKCSVGRGMNPREPLRNRFEVRSLTIQTNLTLGEGGPHVCQGIRC